MPDTNPLAAAFNDARTNPDAWQQRALSAEAARDSLLADIHAIRDITWHTTTSPETKLEAICDVFRHGHSPTTRSPIENHTGTKPEDCPSCGTSRAETAEAALAHTHQALHDIANLAATANPHSNWETSIRFADIVQLAQQTHESTTTALALASVACVTPVGGAVAQDGPGSGPHSAAAGFAGPDAGAGSPEPENGAQAAGWDRGIIDRIIADARSGGLPPEYMLDPEDAEQVKALLADRDAYRDAVVRLTHELLTVSRQNERLAAWVQRERDIADRRQAERDTARDELETTRAALAEATTALNDEMAQSRLLRASLETVRQQLAMARQLGDTVRRQAVAQQPPGAIVHQLRTLVQAVEQAAPVFDRLPIRHSPEWTPVLTTTTQARALLTQMDREQEPAQLRIHDEAQALYAGLPNTGGDMNPTEQAEPADDCLRTADEVRVRGTGRCGWCSYPAAAHPEAGPLAHLDYAEDRAAAARRDKPETNDVD